MHRLETRAAQCHLLGTPSYAIAVIESNNPVKDIDIQGLVFRKVDPDLPHERSESSPMRKQRRTLRAACHACHVRAVAQKVAVFRYVRAQLGRNRNIEESGPESDRLPAYENCVLR